MSPELSVRAAASWGVCLAGATLAVGAALGVAGCDIAPHPPQEVPYTQYDTKPQEHGVCQDTASTIEGEYAAARRCLAAMKDSKVALVTYDDIPTEQAAKIADGATKIVEKATKGLVHLQVTIVPASVDAKQQLFTAEHPNCVDALHEDPSTFSLDRLAADAADATMPELKSEDYVIGATSDPSCSGTVGGIADVIKGRRADIYGVGANPDGDAVGLAHEFLHLDQLGHAGTLTAGRLTPTTTYKLNSKSFDLRAYAQGGTYHEYGRKEDVMGVGATTFIDPNPLHIADLEWPYVVLNSPDASPARKIDVGQDWLTLDTAAAAKGDFVTAQLMSGLTLRDDETARQMQDVAGTHIFTNLAVVPDVAGGRMTGVNFFLQDNNANTVELGFMDGDLRPGHTADEIVLYDDQQFELQVSAEGLRVRELAAQP